MTLNATVNAKAFDDVTQHVAAFSLTGNVHVGTYQGRLYVYALKRHGYRYVSMVVPGSEALNVGTFNVDVETLRATLQDALHEQVHLRFNDKKDLTVETPYSQKVVPAGRGTSDPFVDPNVLAGAPHPAWMTLCEHAPKFVATGSGTTELYVADGFAYATDGTVAARFVFPCDIPEPTLLHPSVLNTIWKTSPQQLSGQIRDGRFKMQDRSKTSLWETRLLPKASHETHFYRRVPEVFDTEKHDCVQVDRTLLLRATKLMSRLYGTKRNVTITNDMQEVTVIGTDGETATDFTFPQQPDVPYTLTFQTKDLLRTLNSSKNETVTLPAVNTPRTVLIDEKWMKVVRVHTRETVHLP